MHRPYLPHCGFFQHECCKIDEHPCRWMWQSLDMSTITSGDSRIHSVKCSQCRRHLSTSVHSTPSNWSNWKLTPDTCTGPALSTKRPAWGIMPLLGRPTVQCTCTWEMVALNSHGLSLLQIGTTARSCDGRISNAYTALFQGRHLWA